MRVVYARSAIEYDWNHYSKRSVETFTSLLASK